MLGLDRFRGGGWGDSLLLVGFFASLEGEDFGEGERARLRFDDPVAVEALRRLDSASVGTSTNTDGFSSVDRYGRFEPLPRGCEEEDDAAS